MPRKYEPPAFLEGFSCTQQQYDRWLHHKAQSHVRRDRRRGNLNARTSDYKAAIHAAVLAGGNSDAYTGEALDWSLIGTYDNESSKINRRPYKQSFALLPTVDHVGDGTGPPDFRICGWRTNDAKHDLSLLEFLELCRKVLHHRGECFEDS